MSLLKIAVYYMQAMSQILSANASTFWGAAFAGIFDISIQRMSEGVSSEKSNDWCFIDGLDSKFKIILDLMAPAMISLFMTMLLVISKCFQKSVVIKGRALNFEAAGLSAFLLITGRVLDTLFKMMSCQSVGALTLSTFILATNLVMDSRGSSRCPC